MRDTKFIVCGNLSIPRKSIISIQRFPGKEICVKYTVPNESNVTIELRSPNKGVLDMMYESILRQVLDTSTLSSPAQQLLDL